MLCYRCGSHVPDTSETCPTCGQKYDVARQAPGAPARRRSSSENAPYKPGDVVAGRFAVQEWVGGGPLGHVFRVLDQAHEVEVALKVISPRLLQEPEERTQFSLVLKVGKKLTHPNMLRVYEEGTDRDRPFFTTQLVEGMTLRRMMEGREAKGQLFTLREVEPLLAQLAAAIDASHRYGPHSDLKPENIIVLPDMLKVTDYGLALGIPRPPFVQAQKGHRVEGYIAPEYVSGGEIDARMDIYSLAAIVGEMLTGLTPDGNGVPEILAKNPELPPSFESLYRRALNANPLARPKTAGEFSTEVSAIVARSPGAASRPSRSLPSVRQAEKPPPPVPTDQLPVAQVAPPGPSRGAKHPEPPSEATQPMDAEMLAAIMAAPPAAPVSRKADAPEPPVRAPAANAPAEPRPAPEPRASKPPSAPRPSMAPGTPAASPPVPPPAPSEPRGVKRRSTRKERETGERRRLLLWLALLTVAGLVTGSAVGYLLLKRLRQGAGAPAPAAGTPSLPVPGAPRAQPPAPQEGPSAVAMAPAGSCPPGMKLVSGGAFKMGSAPDDPDRASDEKPLESRQVPSFCVDEFEFPNRAGVFPTVNVSWLEAKDACQNVGKRLCAEEEWEKACKGAGNARFPYGNEFDANRCSTDDAAGNDRVLAESGRFAQCRSSHGVADLSGNVAEWTSTPYAGGADMTQKGGAFNRSAFAVRCSARLNGLPSARSGTVGFRCCAGLQP
ncbi:bifunctional serine/threonine-protein kinase/formylglycine-generating enzyme family protein [Stigmatella aurantiaca]|uniref:Serine/threonine protein kinase n=1 Tax=Stigmatella aurantiaca (strain DW4/3-1) TaxID=378806 RepID=E3FFL8_STIAD|nr:bifunctional serine/threonine-protein kinase/formylglycine-generating enzyme family protein [Stigmatella aurantiaca]ADO73941.1 serine/threonine protein kinase [Stigmatella aurantiaca DW4/3-1]